MEHQDVASPRIRALAAESRADGTVARFWDEMSAKGTPLIEPIEGEDDDRLVTFVYRGGAEIAGVGLISLISGLADNALDRLPGTDVWYRSWVVANDVRATYQFDPRGVGEQDSNEGAMARFARYEQDPLNPRTYVFERDEEDPDGFELVRSVLQMPGAAQQPLNEWGTDVARGTIEMHRVASRILGNERRVWIYTPAGYDPTRPEPYDLLLLFDGTGFVRQSSLAAILDNLIASGCVPPLVGLMPCSLSQTIRLQELLLHAPFVRFLAEELVPWARTAYRVTEDPARSVVAGASAGGLAAAYAAFEHPELFGKVLSLSGAFAFSPGMLEPGWSGEYEWLTHAIEAADVVPAWHYLSAGSLETKSLRDLGQAPNLVESNRNLYTVLQTKGSRVWLDEFPGGHDMISWQGVIPEGLTALLGDQASA